MRLIKKCRKLFTKDAGKIGGTATIPNLTSLNEYLWTQWSKSKLAFQNR